MPNITPAQREEIIRTLIECRARIAQARIAHLGLDGHSNFELARIVIDKALQVFEAADYPGEVTLATEHLRTAWDALQQFDGGVAVDIILSACKQIAYLEQRLSP